MRTPGSREYLVIAEEFERAKTAFFEAEAKHKAEPTGNMAALQYARGRFDALSFAREVFWGDRD